MESNEMEFQGFFEDCKLDFFFMWHWVKAKRQDKDTT